MLLKQPYIGPKSIIFEVISVISLVISVIRVISVNRRTGGIVAVYLSKMATTMVGPIFNRTRLLLSPYIYIVCDNSGTS